MAVKIDHIGIIVSDIDGILKAYQALGLQALNRETIGEPWYTDAVFMPVGDTEIEFLKPTVPGEGKIADILTERGEGIHHIAFKVDNIVKAMSRLKELEMMPHDLKPQAGSRGTRIAFIEPVYTGGVSIELVEHPD